MRRSIPLCAVALALMPVAAAPAASPGGLAYGTSPAQHLGDRLPLKRGMSGHDVKILQDALTRLGHPVPLTSTFGPRTRLALRAWERSANRRVNGRVDRGDLPGLRSVLGATASVPPPALGVTATLNADGTATPPVGAPQTIVDLFTAANRIATLPYRYGGGHKSFEDTAYDCSSSLSYALHGANLLDRTLDSTGLESWGEAGPGTWITVYANADHTFMIVAGIRFDTSGQRKAGTRWQPAERSTDGFVVRHPTGL
jgi:peptidoglycan hydrolase-like protein with peptidoglycan-binding domain